MIANLGTREKQRSESNLTTERMFGYNIPQICAPSAPDLPRDALHGLTDAANTVIVIEHNLDVIKTADWTLDLGPEVGDADRHIIAQGTPEGVARAEASYTGGSS